MRTSWTLSLDNGALSAIPGGNIKLVVSISDGVVTATTKGGGGAIMMLSSNGGGGEAGGISAYDIPRRWARWALYEAGTSDDDSMGDDDSRKDDDADPGSSDSMYGGGSEGMRVVPGKNLGVNGAGPNMGGESSELLVCRESRVPLRARRSRLS